MRTIETGKIYQIRQVRHTHDGKPHWVWTGKGNFWNSRGKAVTELKKELKQSQVTWWSETGGKALERSVPLTADAFEIVELNVRVEEVQKWPGPNLLTSI